MIDFKKELIGESFSDKQSKSVVILWLWIIFFHLMKIVSWNVNSVRARIDNILQYLKEYNPDIVFLQEIKTQEETFP